MEAGPAGGRAAWCATTVWQKPSGPASRNRSGSPQSAETPSLTESFWRHPEYVEDFEFECWRCWETNVIQGRPKGFWATAHYELASEWECWSCGALNSTPDDLGGSS